MESYKRYVTYGICISGQFCSNTFFYSFNLLRKWFSVKETEMKKKTYWLLNLKPSQGRMFVPKKDVLNNKYVMCMEGKLDKCVMCLD